MALAVESAAERAEVVVMAAAVADYRPASVSEAKIKKETSGDELPLRLVKNPAILAGLTALRRPGQVVVGFAAETAPTREELLDLGRSKAQRKGADLLVVNAVGWAAGFAFAGAGWPGVVTLVAVLAVAAATWAAIDGTRSRTVARESSESPESPASSRSRADAG